MLFFFDYFVLLSLLLLAFVISGCCVSCLMIDFVMTPRPRRCCDTGRQAQDKISMEETTRAIFEFRSIPVFVVVCHIPH